MAECGPPFADWGERMQAGSRHNLVHIVMSPERRASSPKLLYE
jgi:hypothetical protein